jgi:hypothetical protein
MIVYQILYHHPFIVEVEVIKNNTKTVTFVVEGLDGEIVGTERRKKGGVYFETWDDAKAALMSKARHKMANARLEVNMAQGFLGNIKGLRNQAKEKANAS